MSELRPFRALRPVKEYGEKVAALPYDVMTSDEARDMVKGKPYSFLHVDKAEIDLEPGVDLYSPAVYEKAAENLRNLESNGILEQEEASCYYIYSLTREGRSQTGLVACASIDEYISGRIKKHELTREDKEQDRIRHVEICEANTGPIFLAHRPNKNIDGIIKSWIESHKAIYDFISEDGIGHKAWVVDCPEEIEKIREAYGELEALYIADGHHRNASAVKVGLKKRAENPGYTGDEEYNFYLAVVFPSDQLYIMDYNRVVKTLNGRTKEDFLKEVSQKFEASPLPARNKPQKLHDFSMYMDGQWYKLTAKDEIVSKTDPVAALDVSILQDNLLGPILGIGDPRTDKNIDFVGGARGLAELEKRVDSGEMAVAFALYPTSMEELMSVADGGLMMPPKSTWFEPKLRSGLFIHKLF